MSRRNGMRDSRVSRSLFAISRYLIFFVLISFAVTCSFLLFFQGLHLDEAAIRASAVPTFLNILFLSFLGTVIDSLRRRYTVKRPVERILEATRRVTQGDFSARIKPVHRLGRQNEFDVIIDDFNQMAEELAGTETLRADFIANVSHELKTPLAVIGNYAVMLQSQSVTEEERMRYAKAISAASCRLADLITNILKLSKLENQQIFPKTQEYHLDEQLCQCLLAFEETWEEKELEIDSDICELTIKSDPELLSLVWNNLFSNAVKFTGPGGRISVSLKEEDGCAVVQVTDTGCGISPEVGRHIFEKFYQGDTSHGTQGNGLGLALVKRVVDIVGGEISVESTVGKGSTFIVRLNREGRP